MKANYKSPKTDWEYNERVRILSLTPISGWGVFCGEVVNLFKFYGCEVENWIEANQNYNLGDFLDYAAEIPVYFFATWDEAKSFAERTSNRYPIDRRLYWLRFQSEYWFSSVFVRYLDIIRYLTSEERLNELRKLSSDGSLVS